MTPSLNEAFDSSTDERFGFALKLPSQIFWLIVGLSVLSMGVVGYQIGLKGFGSVNDGVNCSWWFGR